jgi:hypothetical protein
VVLMFAMNSQEVEKCGRLTRNSRHDARFLHSSAFMATGIEWFRKGAQPSRDYNQGNIFLSCTT